VVEVAIPPREGGTDAIFTYASDDAVVGDALFVPLGNREALGYVVAAHRLDEAELGFSFSRLRQAGEPVAGLGVPEAIVAVARFVSEEYLSPFTQSLAVVLPPGVRDRLGVEWTLNPPEQASSAPLTPAQREVVRSLEDSGGRWIERPGKPLPEGSLKLLRLLRAKGVVRARRVLVPFQESKKPEQIRLSPDEGAIEAFIRKEGRKKPAQALTLMTLQGSGSATFSHAEAKALCGVTEATLGALLKAGLLVRAEDEAFGTRAVPEPNAEQQAAIEAITDAVRNRRADRFLLHGVTGSGKTEVYLRAAAESLRLGRPVLFLVPEIALTAQVVAQLRDRFGRAVAVLHSDLPPRERLDNWMRIRSGEASVVLGPRSALFAPLSDVGLIVMDEEHEASYKQESNPRYHAKRVATFLADRFGAPLVLGSATPSLESYQESLDAQLIRLELKKRAANAQLPSVQVEDLRVGYQEGHPAIFTPVLADLMDQALERREQVILFLNRRAYSSFMLCRSCGHRFMCPHCAVALSYHRSESSLRCHHCDHRMRAPDICPQCGGTKVKPMGMGTEKVEETVAKLFEHALVDRLDRDIARKRGALESVLAGFRSGSSNVLVGTQMVAKGLDFPNVTVVGVILADITLNVPDFRAGERTFQLLSQVAGRAGRGRKPGSVVIQTFNPENVAVLAAQAHDYEGFFAAAIEHRRDAAYPPFVRLVNIVASGEDRAAVARATAEIKRRLQGVDAMILGPTDCPIERIQQRYRRHLLLKLAPNAPASPIGAALEGFAPKNVQITIDVDPNSLM